MLCAARLRTTLSKRGKSLCLDALLADADISGEPDPSLVFSSTDTGRGRSPPFVSVPFGAFINPPTCPVLK
jgi:hypothetical protein